jgi:hypothetical protein
LGVERERGRGRCCGRLAPYVLLHEAPAHISVQICTACDCGGGAIREWEGGREGGREGGVASKHLKTMNIENYLTHCTLQRDKLSHRLSRLLIHKTIQSASLKGKSTDANCSRSFELLKECMKNLGLSFPTRQV